MSASLSETVGIIQDWFGKSGKPVPPALAQSRSEICATCPYNRKTGWLDSVKTHVADLIKSRMEFKSQAKIGVAGEENIGLCDVCGCVLRLLVHVPISHIKEHTPVAQIEQYPGFCWKRQEIEKESQ